MFCSMYRRTLRSALLPVFVFCFALTPVAPAFSQVAGQGVNTITSAIRRSTESRATDEKLMSQQIEDALRALGDTVNRGIAQELADKQEALSQDASNDSLLQMQLGLPMGLAQSRLIEGAVNEARYRELVHAKPNQSGTNLARGIADSTVGSLASDVANVRIFMDYFCDPNAANGEMGKIGVAEGAAYNIVMDGQKITCGKEREAALGKGDVIGNAQLAGLPMRPHMLFFEPVTFPVISDPGNIALKGQTNRLADLVFGAYMYFQRLVIGKPSNASAGFDFNNPSTSEAYLTEQSRNARLVLTGYPFARLYSERMGTMGAEVAESAGRYMIGRYGGATVHPQVLAMVKEIESKPALSWAEFADITMNRALSAPGYLQQINTMSPARLQREKLYLMSLQTMLRYHTNSWMEIRAAITAVQP